MLYVYTDGSVVRPREGTSPGGWAYSFEYQGQVFNNSGFHESGTNQRMEMLAAINALVDLYELGFKGERVCIISDSQYLVFGASQWMQNWKRNGWRNGNNKRIKNKDYWQRLDVLAKDFQTRWKWVRGHNGNPQNEIVDKLARNAAFRYDNYLNLANLKLPDNYQDVR